VGHWNKIQRGAQLKGEGYRGRLEKWKKTENKQILVYRGGRNTCNETLGGGGEGGGENGSELWEKICRGGLLRWRKQKEGDM